MKKISNILLLIKRAWRVSKIMFLVYFIKLCLDVAFPFVGITYSTLIITALTESIDSNVILSYILQMVLISLAIKLLLNIILLINIDFQNKTNNQTGADLLKEYMEIDYKFNESGDMQNLRQSFFLYILPAEFLPVLGRLFTGIFTVFGCFYIVLEIHPLMLIVILLFIFIKILAVKKQNKIDYEWSIEKIPAQKKLNYLSYVMTSYDFSKEIRINGGQDWVKNKFKGILSLYDISLCKMCNKKIKPSLLITIIDIMQQLIVYMYLSFRVIGNTLSIGALNMLLQVISLFYSSINAVFDNILYLSKTSDYVEKYKEYNELVKAAETTGTESIEQIDDVEIEFKNVTMIYPDSDKVVLKDISFKVNAKENIAIVGLNGAGKTTFIKLLCGFYKPTEGQ